VINWRRSSVELTSQRSTGRGEISQSRVSNKVPEKSTLILEAPEFPYNTGIEKASMPKTARSVKPFCYNTDL